MQRPIEIISITVGILGALVSPAIAQMGRVAYSIEWQVASSDLVVRASISQVVREPIRATRYQPQIGDAVITLKVHETLKGTAAESVSFLMDLGAEDNRFDRWRGAVREDLWFLVRNEKYNPRAAADAPIATRIPFKIIPWMCLIGLDAPTPGDGTRDREPATFDMKFRVLSERTQILEAARAAASFKTDAIPVERRILLPRPVMELTGYGGDVNSLVVPVDSRLEPMARRLIQSPSDILTGRLNDRTDLELASMRTMLRREGIRAIQHFKSDENIALVRSQLGDETVWGEHIGEDDASAVRLFYVIRREAHTTLKAWNVDPGPVVLEPPAQP